MEVHEPFPGSGAAVAQERETPARPVPGGGPGGCEPAGRRGAGGEGIPKRAQQQKRAHLAAGGELQAPRLGESRRLHAPGGCGEAGVPEALLQGPEGFVSVAAAGEEKPVRRATVTSQAGRKEVRSAIRPEQGAGVVSEEPSRDEGEEGERGRVGRIRTQELVQGAARHAAGQRGVDLGSSERDETVRFGLSLDLADSAAERDNGFVGGHASEYRTKCEHCANTRLATRCRIGKIFVLPMS